MGWADLPLINLIIVLANLSRLYEWMTDCSLSFGWTWTVVLPMQLRFVGITHPDDVKHVLRDNFDNYVKGETFGALVNELLGGGIFNSDGKAWYRQRKIASHLFHVRNFKETMVPVFLAHARKVARLLDATAATGHHAVIDMHDVFYRYTLDSAGVIAFSKDIGSLENRDVPFARAFDYLQWGCLMRGFTPLWWLWRDLGLSPIENRMRRELAVLDDYIRTAVLDSDDPPADGQQGASIIELFKASSLRPDSLRHGPDDEAGREEELLFLRDLVVNFIIAGRDTTGAALSWLFYLLAMHPQVRDEVVAEIDEVLDGADMAYGDIPRLPLLHAAVKETLRLYPSVPRDLKVSVSADVLPGSGAAVAPGVWIVYMPYVMGRLPALWGPDAASFRPQRWLEPDFEPPSAYKFIAFNAGKRSCLGERMAYQEIMACSVHLLQRFVLDVAPGADVRPATQITLAMANGLPMNVRER
ncbi:cytochrome P450 CYP86A34 [Thecamonas trahens ATCC 50062]|uniref:Cytochrome P450 CYP86A34 n=1 Tax=Thecamonas trahens ATCC 50062 TaxID=461836 RepID=A0A0L0DQ12_THETB|nr:cytochrome P450 CYP86A34 [Thecamonas trahens ATCC 50062]KNC54392.1 cytochrome P450 CYP86A34 [Thecamonas trahens ATCC 50062]|eukprot:XP_013753691.1 cytochrome P450 CYP86A34 [Thecamonas trahens ATCC 50062]